MTVKRTLNTQKIRLTMDPKHQTIIGSMVSSEKHNNNSCSLINESFNKFISVGNSH